MRLFCLSDLPNKPCYVLRFKGVTLMLDCSLDMTTSLHFMPIPLVHSTKLAQLTKYLPKDGPDVIDGELRESTVQGRVFIDSVVEFGAPDTGAIDFASIDAILVSNYTTMMALPFITEETDFRGMILMTEPTLHFGRIFMEEAIEFIERTATSRGSTRSGWKDVLKNLPPPLCNVTNPKSWRTIYTREQMESCLNKVTMVGFSEQKDIFGLLTVSPASSGYCIGSSNWLISSGFEKVVYVSGSSTLTTHLKLMEKDPLRNADCLIITALTQTPTTNPDPMLGEFCKTVVDTTKQGGNVLVPCYPSGIVYDLFECLAGQMDANGLSHIPMYFISPVADASLAYSNIMAEWLSTNKQNRVYLPEEPFIHGNLSRTNRLRSFKNLYDENFSNEYRQPCVMFCGHPSLRFGDVIHFIELWGGSSTNTIVFTEPSFPYLDALAPFQPLLMKAVSCPIDTSINFNQAKTLIRDLRPAMIACPEVYSIPPLSVPQRKDLVLDVDIPRHLFARYESIKLPLKIKFEQISIDPKLASKINPVEIRSGVAVASITGNLVVTNNKYFLKELPEASVAEISAGKKRKHPTTTQPPVSMATKLSQPKEHLYGKLNPRELIQKLTAMGVQDARLEEKSPGSYMIHLSKEDTLIQVEDFQTHVVSDASDLNDRKQLRNKIRDALLACLNKF